MPTIDKIIEDNLHLVFGSKNRLMKMDGFDYAFSVSTNISENGKDYSQTEAVRIGMIADELVLNSIKAIYGVENPHRASNIHESRKIKGRIRFNVYEDKRNYILSCQDNGCGILEENKNRVFDNGFSTRGTTGIGLGMIRDHVTDLGGRTYFDSEVGVGTTFYVKLPK